MNRTIHNPVLQDTVTFVKNGGGDRRCHDGS